MADLRGCYSTNDRPTVGFEVLPAGTYMVKITSGEWKDTQKGGKYLQVNMVVTDGTHKDAIVVDRLNLVNSNPKAVQIARGQFAALREAIGIPEPKDTADLCGPRFQAVLRAEKSEYTDKETGEIKEGWQNRVVRYLKRDESAATPQQHQGNPPQARNAPPQVGEDGCPW